MSADDVGTWLYARHAIERNARIAQINLDMPDGGSGMMNNQARDILAQAAAGPHAARLNAIGALIDQMRERTLKAPWQSTSQSTTPRGPGGLVHRRLSGRHPARAYDPGSKRSPIPTELEDIAARLGLELSHDTILKYLRLGAQHLPKNWKPHQ
ncbi:hypothetical protein MASR1M32_39600 [Rhodobacter sp.]